MIRTHGRARTRYAALAAVGLLAVVGCSSSSKKAVTTTPPAATTASTTASTTAATTASSATTPATTPAGGSTATSPTATSDTTASTATADTTPSTSAAPAAWKAPVDKCSDPDAVTKPITGEIKVGSVLPISGTPAVAFAPVKEGLELYYNYANANNLLPGVKITSEIKDDQYDPTQTPTAVDAEIDDKVDMFSGIIGTPNNIAVRDELNTDCYPQLNALSGDPAFADAKDYPWTTGALVPYDIEAKIYVAKLKDLIGDGGTIGLFSVNSDFGKVYTDAFKAAASDAGLKIVDEETIEPDETAPPTNQVDAIAAKKPAAIMAIPLGAQCPTFLQEVKKAEAATSGWTPIVFQTNTCALTLLISTLAAGAGDGVYTSSNILDPGDPANASNAGVKAFQAAYAAAGLKDDPSTVAVGWTVAESTVNILAAAQKTGTLSRETIMEAARSITFTPSLGRPGTVYKMNGLTDTEPFQSLTVLQWNEKNKTYTDIGTENSTFES
ncbi:MAG TPA: ABC transporter substrate-binding protein [Ilumatobacteraceae bacterium]